MFSCYHVQSSSLECVLLLHCSLTRMCSLTTLFSTWICVIYLSLITATALLECMKFWKVLYIVTRYSKYTKGTDFSDCFFVRLCRDNLTDALLKKTTNAYLKKTDINIPRPRYMEPLEPGQGESSCCATAKMLFFYLFFRNPLVVPRQGCSQTSSILQLYTVNVLGHSFPRKGVRLGCSQTSCIL